MLTWNVYTGDFSSQRIKVFNIFEHISFSNGCKKAAELSGDDAVAFAESIRRELQYYFWRKCEWEVILSGWPSRDTFHTEKVDVYSQIMLNFDVFIDYLWRNKVLLKGDSNGN